MENNTHSKDTNWVEEFNKCMNSPYYFYITYTQVQTPEGLKKATTRLTEEVFNEMCSKGQQRHITFNKDK